MSVDNPTLTRPALLRRGLLLEYLTVGWNLVEGIVAVVAGVLAASPALIGFGVDSAVESVSGSFLIWRLRAEVQGGDAERIEHVEERAEKLVGVSFLLLAAYVTWDAVTSLLSQEKPSVSIVGILLTAVSIPVMLW